MTSIGKELPGFSRVKILNDSRTQMLIKLLTVTQTQIQMISDRGYQLQELDETLMKFNPELEADLNAFDNLRGQYWPLRVYTKANQSILVYYAIRQDDQKKVGVKMVNDFVEQMLALDVTDAILVIDVSLSSAGNELLSKIIKQRWQVFKWEELCLIVNKHSSYCPHVKLSPEERRQVLLEFRSNSGGIPIIISKDPVAKYYGWLPGDIVAITRDDGVNLLCPQSCNYRLVLEMT